VVEVVVEPAGIVLVLVVNIVEVVDETVLVEAAVDVVLKIVVLVVGIDVEVVVLVVGIDVVVVVLITTGP
jgi:hypothetical protein